MTLIEAAFAEAWRQRRQRVIEKAAHVTRFNHLQAKTMFIASTDYVTRDEHGQYIDHHLYRVPVSVAAIGV